MTTRIVFLDVGTVSRGDLDLKPFRQLGVYREYNDSRPDQVVARSRGADVVVTNKCLLGKAELEILPDLRLIGVTATGVNNVDLQWAARKGIAVTNVPGYSTTTVAEQALMFLLALGHRLDDHHRFVMEGRWSASGSFSTLRYPFSDLEGKTLGIIGYGAIGRRVAQLARGLRMNVLVARIPGRAYPRRDKRIPLHRLLVESDFISLHAPLSHQTFHLIDRQRLASVKKGAFLVNLARGPLIDELAVAAALRSGRLAGYASDVMEEEPPPKHHSFLRPDVRDKVLLTPHVGWASRESRQRLIAETAASIEAFLKGRKRNRVV